MKEKNSLKLISWFSLAGAIFAGYLSATKLISGTCPFNESCYYLLGYPTCLYGLIMFLAIFTATGLALAGKTRIVKTFKLSRAVSFAGILFSGHYVLKDIVLWLNATPNSIYYELVLPTCAYGLAVYAIIFAIAFNALSALKKRER